MTAHNHMPATKKSLGQHWLNDRDALADIAAAADLGPDDTVLEIGPGPGTLTKLLCKQAGRVIAVELDEVLAKMLPERVKADNLEVAQADILRYDLTTLPPDYKVVANIPYYLTSNLIRVLSDTSNPPSTAVLLMQKEVAQRVCAPAGQTSVLSVTAQYYWQATLGSKVPAMLFTPPPKVDSQVLILHRRAEELFEGVQLKPFFRLVKAGFGERRKTLRNALSGGLHLSKPDTETVLNEAGIDPMLRAQNLTLEQWHQLYLAWQNMVR